MQLAKVGANWISRYTNSSDTSAASVAAGSRAKRGASLLWWCRCRDLWPGVSYFQSGCHCVHVVVFAYIGFPDGLCAQHRLLSNGCRSVWCFWILVGFWMFLDKPSGAETESLLIGELFSRGSRQEPGGVRFQMQEPDGGAGRHAAHFNVCHGKEMKVMRRGYLVKEYYKILQVKSKTVKNKVFISSKPVFCVVKTRVSMGLG